MEKQEVIQVSHLSKQYKNTLALKDLNFSMHKGEIFGFLGPSGAGKTTTIKILTGQLRQTSGDAFVLGNPVQKINENIYEQVGIVTDNSGLFEKLTVYDNLLVFCKILNVDKTQVDILLKKVGLYSERKKPAGKLSKGMKQRLVLLRAILHKPKVLFLDEPTSGLDPASAEAVHSLLLELKKSGTAIFLTTHNMAEATKLCDEVALLNDGYIMEQGSPEGLCLKFNKNKKYQILLKDNTEVLLNQSVESAEKISEWLSKDEILKIHSCEPTLENVFLEVTGRDLA